MAAVSQPEERSLRGDHAHPLRSGRLRPVEDVVRPGSGWAESGATSHMVSRAVDNPNEAFIRVEFPSAEQAKAFREKLLASGALERGGMRIKTGPTVAEVADQHTY
jgi:hypothetical protein